MKKITPEIMEGSIFEALKKAKVNPSNDKKVVGEILSIILSDDKTKYAFAKACEKQGQSPKILAKRAIKSWLKENGYL